jgi:peptidoglycan hydrolase-like protein with peptidoglycan-binding domain
MASIINASVGRRGANNPCDVRVVQRLLNDYFGAPVLVVDGLCGPKTVAAIHQFQAEVTGLVDDRVDPHGPAIKKLAELHLRNALSGLTREVIAYLPSLSDLPSRHPPVALVQEYWRLLRNA